MKLVAAGRSFEVVEATSPVPGRRAVVLVEAGGKAWPDLFLWDPMSQTVQYDGEQLREFIVSAALAQSKWAAIVLAITDAVTGVGRAIHRMASGGYGGSFGFGSAGGLIAAAGAIFNLLVQVAAFAATLPFRLLGGAVRLWLTRSVQAEEAKLVQAMPAVFAALPAIAREAVAAPTR
jgi:hypothetical protein